MICTTAHFLAAKPHALLPTAGRAWVLLWIALVSYVLTGCTVSPPPTTAPTAPERSTATDIPVSPSPDPSRDDGSTPDVPTTENVPGLVLPPGYSIRIAAEGLLGPTQMIRGPDDWLWVAQLDGPENAGEGEVLALSLETGERRILLQNLLKPTGIAILEGALWIAAERTLLRAPLVEEGGAISVGEAETVLADLPYNGRSNGTLTVTPQRTLLYETSGRRRGNEAAAGSATLWELDPAAPDEPQPLATGLKGAYAHTFDGDGRLWTVEIGDDPVNGAPPPDELNLVVPGADFGWPRCFGQQEPALNYGGSAEFCAETRAPVALFPPRSTPVSIVPSPWAEDVLLVALWLDDVVQVSVTFSEESDNATGTVDPFLQGVENPQHLLVWDENRLLVSDFRNGTIYLVQQFN